MSGILEGAKVVQPNNYRSVRPWLWKKQIVINEQTGCWDWVGTKCPDGYGKVNFYGTDVSAHQLLWRLFCGSVEAGKEIHHKCHNRACCNPAHLEPVTHSENVARSVARRIAKGERTKHYRKRP